MDNNPYASDAYSTVVKTKLLKPSPRSEHVPRPGLLELLDAGYDRRLTLIDAPAGYGKTTLLAQWRQAWEPDIPFAWLSLDDQDSDPVRLWKHVVEALRRVAPEDEWGADVLEGLGLVKTKHIDTVVPLLINALTDLPHRVVLVLDDYHCIQSSDSHEAISFFIEHLPNRVHLVISTRSDPPLGMGRLRARGEVSELRTEQLAFSEGEAAHLLNETMRLDVGADDLSVLLERTEGWPAAIYLAALSLQNREDKHAFIESFGGSNRYIVDLLAEEVLASFPHETREFLLRTSVLRRMTGPLCDAVAGVEGSSHLLRELAHSNLFVVPLDDPGEWYRYHHLFSDFLLYELESSRPNLVPVLRNRASVWAEGAGLFGSAIRQAIAAADDERVGMLISRHWFGYVLAGQAATVERWLEALPEASIDSDAALVLVKAWLCALSGRRGEAERFLALAESNSYEGRLPDGTASVESGIALIRGVFGLGGVQVMLEAAQLAAEMESKQTSPRTALAYLGLGLSLHYSGAISRARRPLEEGLRLSREGQPVLRIVLLSALSFVAGDEGHLEEAESLAREARGLVERFRLQDVPQSTSASTALGCALAKRGKLAEAQVELEDGLLVRRRLPGLNPWPTMFGLLALAQVRFARGDRGGAREVLTEARAILEQNPDAGNFPELVERQERKLRRIRRRDGSLDGELTDRELDVLGLLAGELSTRQMAQSLYVAPSTVRTQIKSIYRKLGASSREEAVEEARDRGLV